MSDSSIIIIQGTVGLYTVATRCHRCFAVTLKYTEDSSLKILPHSLAVCWEWRKTFRVSQIQNVLWRGHHAASDDDKYRY